MRSRRRLRIPRVKAVVGVAIGAALLFSSTYLIPNQNPMAHREPAVERIDENPGRKTTILVHHFDGKIKNLIIGVSDFDFSIYEDIVEQMGDLRFRDVKNIFVEIDHRAKGVIARYQELKRKQFQDAITDSEIEELKDLVGEIYSHTGGSFDRLKPGRFLMLLDSATQNGIAVVPIDVNRDKFKQLAESKGSDEFDYATTPEGLDYRNGFMADQINQHKGNSVAVVGAKHLDGLDGLINSSESINTI